MNKKQTPCPDCSQVISKNAVICPQCGRLFFLQILGIVFWVSFIFSLLGGILAGTFYLFTLH